MKPLTDPKIEVAPEIGKKIAQIVCAEIKESLSGNQKRYELMKRCQNQYNQVSKWAEQGKVCNEPWTGAADYFIPLTEWIIDAVHARVMNVLFSQEPFMTARGVESSDVAKADGVTDFMDMAFREIVKVYDNTKFFFKQIIILPFAVLKYDWVQKYDRMIVKEEAQVFVNQATQEEQYLLPDDPDAQVRMAELVMNGFTPAGMKEVWIAEDKELINQPNLKYIRAEDYVYSPNAKRDSNLFWEGDRFYMTLNEMKLEAKQEKFIEDSVSKVKNSVINDNNVQGIDAIIAQKSKPIECFYWYGRLPFNEQNEIDLESQDTIEQEVCCVVSYKEEELLQILHWPYKRIPFPDRVYVRGEFEETEEFEGRSLAQKLYMTQKELNTLHNTIMNNAQIAMQKIFAKKRMLQGDEWDKPSVYPGAIWEEDAQGDIRVLEVGDVKQIGLALEQTLLNFAERISNISVFQTGTARQEGGQKTLGEVQSTIHEGNIGLDKFVQNCHNILRKICQWTLDYYYERMPEGLERRILGEEGEPIFPTQENMAMFAKQGINPTWSQDDLGGKFDFIWNGTSLNSSKEWKLTVANDLMERYLPHPMVAGNMMATWEILKRGLIARGEKDWQTILPKREAIVAEMQRMSQEAKVKTDVSAAKNRLIQKIDQATNQRNANAGQVV
jgi:hypothetical protein